MARPWIIQTLFFNIIFDCVTSTCTPVISEINTDNPPKHDAKEFIELEFICSDSSDQPDTSGLKVLLIKGLSSRKPQITFLASLPTALVSQYYVIGGSAVVPSPDLLFTDANVRSSQKVIQRGQRTLFDVVVNGNKYPEAVVLVKISGKDARTLDSYVKFDAKKNFADITDDTILLLKPYLLDMVVYARKSGFTECSVFEALYPGFSGKDYVLRDFSETTSATDYSLNRCTDNAQGFIPDKFKVGSLTPGSANDCSGAEFLLRVLLASSFPQQPSSVRGVLPDEQSTEQHRTNTATAGDQEHTCSAVGISAADVYATPIGTTEAAMESAASSGECWALPSTSATSEADVRSEEGAIMEMIEGAGDEPVAKKMKTIAEKADNEWDTAKYFDNTWIAFVRNNLASFFDPDWFNSVPGLKTWIELEPNAEDPTETKFFCRICRRNYDMFSFKRQEKPKLATGATLNLNPAQKRKNREMLIEHVSGRSKKAKGQGDKTITSSKHQQVITAMQEAEKSKYKTATEKVMQIEESETDEGKFVATCNMLRLVYLEAKLNIPFSAHPQMVSCGKRNGAKLGSHHSDRMSATRMLNLIGTSFRKKLVGSLTANMLPLALIVDTTTDGQGNHFLICYIRSLEQDKDINGDIKQERPVVYFYKLIKLGQEETAEAMLQTLLASFTEDSEPGIDFKQTVRRLLYALGSDGASVMIGRTGGLIKKLTDFAGRPVMSTHCMAHRLQLATGRAWKNQQNFHRAEDFVNSVYLFYNNRGHRRKGHLMETAEAMGEIYYEFVQIFRIRWLLSEQAAVSKVRKAFRLLADDLQEISENPGGKFSDTTAREAKGILGRLENKHLLAFLAFLDDVLQALGLVSAKLQRTTGVLVGKHKFFSDLRANMLGRKENLAVEEVKLYQESLCRDRPDDEWEACQTLEKYEESVFVKFKDRMLNDKTTRFKPLSTIRATFLDGIVGELDAYFPLDTFKDFDALHPQALPSSEIEVATSPAIAAMGRIATLFGISSSEAIDGWKRVLTAIVAHPDFERLRRGTPVEFYGLFLANNNIPWHNAAKLVIRNTLIVPVGSADAERGFSVLKHVKYDRRSRLGVVALNTLLQIRVNGPAVEKFNTLPFAKLWQKEGHLLSDSAEQAFPRRNLNQQEKDLDKDLEYIFEFSDSGKEYLKKSNIFFTLK